MIEISDHDKRVLGIIGRGPYGKELTQIIVKARNQLSSLDSIDTSKPYTDQVEGRLLFKEFADELVDHLARPDRQMRRLDTDDYS